jgi:hypothetical protein
MTSTSEAPLASWRDTATTRAILEFVAAATRESEEGWIPPPERVAVFDNDGTPSCVRFRRLRIGLLQARNERIGEHFHPTVRAAVDACARQTG